MKSARLWEWAAKRYDRKAHTDEDYTRAVERFAKHLDADDTVLDFACGTGVVTFKIAADVKEVLGIDTSARMIELAKERAREREVQNVRFARKTIFDGELAKESYDAILAFNILHLLEDARKAVQRARELLKPGGLLVCLTPCIGEAGVVLRVLVRLLGKVVLPYLRAFRVSDVEALIRDAGLQTLASEVLEDSVKSHLIVARKH